MSMNKGQALGLIEREIERFVASLCSKRLDEIVPVTLGSVLNVNDLNGHVIRAMVLPWFGKHLTEHGTSWQGVQACYICQTVFTEVSRRHDGDINFFVRNKLHHFIAEMELMG